MIAAMVGLALLGTVCAEAAPADGDEISRSRGKRDGVVVLYPRIVPTPQTESPQLDALAAALQGQLQAMAERIAGDPKLVNVRPAPQRVCPQAGCRAASVGVMLGHRDGGCVAVAIVGAPDQTNRTLVPWAGGVMPSSDQIPFREPPEQRAVISDFVPCGELTTRLEHPDVEAALYAAMTGGT